MEVKSYPWYDTRHHPDSGRSTFHNIWRAEKKHSLLKSALWTISYLVQTQSGIEWLTRRPHRSRKGNRPTPFCAIPPAALAERPPGYRLYWLGQNSILMQIGDQTILTDPVFSRAVGPVVGPPRHVALPLLPEQIPQVDVVLISHDHYDHLDRPSVRELEQRFRPLFLVPLGGRQRLLTWGVTRVLEMDWWQYVEHEGISYHCVPAKHHANRSFLDVNKTLWAGWLIEDPRRPVKVFFAGDTAYSDHFQEIRRHLGAPEVALLPIGSYAPRWYLREFHVDPDESLQAFLDLEAEHFVGIHWGTFDVTAELLHEPAELTPQLAQAKGIPADRVHILPVGGCFPDGQGVQGLTGLSFIL